MVLVTMIQLEMTSHSRTTTDKTEVLDVIFSFALNMQCHSQAHRSGGAQQSTLIF